jgi:hypothetical protein
MNGLEEILHQAQKILTCPQCGRSFEISEIQLKGMWGNTLIFQTSCQNNHPPVNSVFVVSYKKSLGKSYPLGQKPALQPITTDDVLDGAEVIDAFDGDFEKLWRKS